MIKFIKTFVLFMLIFIISCDVIEEPIIPVTGTYNIAKYGIPPTFSQVTEDMKVQRVLIEDFTGHTCGNCPAAAIIAEEIKEEHPSLISIFAIHAGSFAIPDDVYPLDLQTEVGDVFWNIMIDPSNPIGRINRSPNEEVFQYPPLWNDDVETQLALDPTLVLQLKHDLVSEDGILNVHVYTESISSYEGNVKITALIVESGIIGDQKDYSQTEEHVHDYEFEHVLRDAINSPHGVNYTENPETGFSSQKDYSYQYDSSWNILNCSIIAYAYDENTGRILNVVEQQISE